MAEALKDRYLSTDFFQQFSKDLKSVYPQLNKNQFYNQCVASLDELELKQRITHLTETVADHLPDDYSAALAVLYQLSPTIGDKLGYLFMSEFVSTYGLDHYELSINALRDFTHHSSSEFAIREFLKRDFKTTMQHMLEWTEHENEHIRRLASEGCRPRLPWASKLPEVIENPNLTWKILNQLKTDPSKYVQKSVANHLNDISKDNPDWLVKKISRWKQNNETTAWIIKHGCRTLIKQGNKNALILFGVDQPKLKLTVLKLKSECVNIGNRLDFTIKLSSSHTKAQKIIIDYKIYFLRKNDTYSEKVFKLKTVTLDVNEKKSINKSHSFALINTRKYYPGKHFIEVMINGESMRKKAFYLK